MSEFLKNGIILSATDLLSPVLENAIGNLNILDQKISSVSDNIIQLGSISSSLGEQLSIPLEVTVNGITSSIVTLSNTVVGELSKVGVSIVGSLLPIVLELTKLINTAKEVISSVTSAIESLSNISFDNFTKITTAVSTSSVDTMNSLLSTVYTSHKEQVTSSKTSIISGIKKLEIQKNVNQDEKKSSIKGLGHTLPSASMSVSKELNPINQQTISTSTLLGGSFLPVVKEVTQSVKKVSVSVTTWVDTTKELISPITVIFNSVTSLINTTKELISSVKGTFDAFKSLTDVTKDIGSSVKNTSKRFNVMGGVSKAFSKILPFLGKGLNMLSGAFRTLGSVVRGVSSLMIANPIIAGVMAIAAAAYLIYDNWDAIFSWFENKLASVSGLISSVTSFFGFGDSDVNVNSKSEKKVTGIQKLEGEVKSTGVTASNAMINKNRNNSSSKVVHSSPTYNVTVTNPKSDVDVIRAIKAHERNVKNKSFEDQ